MADDDDDDDDDDDAIDGQSGIRVKRGRRMKRRKEERAQKDGSIDRRRDQSGSDNNRTDSPFSTERTVRSVIITAARGKLKIASKK